MARLVVGALPGEPLAAAAMFHGAVLPRIAAALPVSGALTLVFEPAGAAHQAWRLAVVQGLARAHAPLRINAVAGARHAEVTAWLEQAEAVTGQLLHTDGGPASPVLG